MKESKFRKKSRDFVVVFFLMLLTACGSEATVTIDFADEAVFETALNNGENLEGKVVTFTALEIHPDSVLGFNVWAGEHLNFVSQRNPDIAVGDLVTVKATTIENQLGSWVIHYEKIENAVVGETTVSNIEEKETVDSEMIEDVSENEEYEEGMSDTAANVSTREHMVESSATASFDVKTVKEEKKELKLVDYGWYLPSNKFGSDTIYMRFCAIIHNPNTELVANFPKVNVTIKNGDGTILTTDSQTGSCVMPEDTVTIIGSTSVPVVNLSEDTQITFDVECDNFGIDSFGEGLKTTDFAVENVSEQEGDKLSITGEITNNTEKEVDMVNLSIVLRKEGQIVYMDNTYVDNLAPGKPKAFEVSQYDEYPEHDTIDVSVQEW